MSKLKVKHDTDSRKVSMGYTNKQGIRYLSSSEQAKKTKRWPRKGHKGTPAEEALRKKLISRGHGYLRD